MRHKKPAERNIGVEIDPVAIKMWEGQPANPALEIQQGDAISFFTEFEFQGGELVYSDPPYLARTRRQERVYTYDYNDADHMRLISVLKQLPCYVMLSGYDNELYNTMLPEWRKVTFNAKTHTDVREECVWLNFPEPEMLHDSRYLGSTYRERQTIQRRQMRIRSRIDGMPPIERNELLRWAAETYGPIEEIA
jgi:hypothetical protein